MYPFPGIVKRKSKKGKFVNLIPLLYFYFCLNFPFFNFYYSTDTVYNNRTLTDLEEEGHKLNSS